MRYTILYIALFLTFTLNGQISLEKDTIRISEVIISRKSFFTEPTGYKNATFDSAILATYSHRTVADLLSLKSGIFIKSYGMGGTASPSFRGTGAGHTQVAWNGINIGHPMLGQSDLSLLPAGMSDNIRISFGGASMFLGSGGIGGMISLESKPDWLNKTSVTISPGVGSFSQYSGLISVKSGNTKFQSATKIFYTAAENDFRFLNSEISSTPVWETRTNNQVKQSGLMQELYYRWHKNIITGRIWYQSSNRNLPSSMLISQLDNTEKQSDESLRAMANFSHEKDASKFYLTGAWMMNRLNYSNSLASIDSRNLSNSATLKTGIEKKIFNNSSIRLELNEDLIKVKSNNYDKRVYRNTASFTISSDLWITDRLSTSILTREILDQDIFLIPDFSTGIQLRLKESKDYFLKANFSRDSRIPTLNDMNWVPGGNPDLKNEYAFIYEISYKSGRDLWSHMKLNYDISLYLNTIKDMILWRPGSYSYWTADNIQNVNTMGVETNLSVKLKTNKLSSIMDLSYTYTKAYDSGALSSGNQLLYIPEYLANASLLVTYNNINASWISNLTGRRFITTDNLKYLPGYLINSFAAGYKIRLKENTIGLNICVDNMFNVYYQTVAYFPLPGRSYSFNLTIQLNK